MIDPLGELRRMQSMDNNKTFDPATDSLEAIANALGLGPGVGLWMLGRCDAAMAASLTVITTDNLGASLPDDVFNNEFWMQVIHNANAVGVAPEAEIRRITDFVGATQAFTVDAFTANVEADDLVAIFHESVLPSEILARGTLTVSSATVPADAGRGEANNYFRGHLLMTTEGAMRFRPTRIVEFANAGGVFTLDPSNPLTAVPGLVDYIIIGSQAEFVPAADSAINRTPADAIGNKSDAAIFIVSAVASLMAYIKGILATINSAVQPSRSLVETWQDVLGIDPTVWVTVDPATGAAWAAPTESGGFLYAETTLNANETARLRSVQQWVASPNTPNLYLVIKKTILEWEMVVGAVANLDNAITFWGFTNGPNDNRATNNLIGFGLVGDALQSVTDSGGVETVATGFGENLTAHTKLRIEIYESTVDFYVDEVLVATSAANIPVNPMYIQMFLDTDGGGACAFDIGIVRCWYEMVERY